MKLCSFDARSKGQPRPLPYREVKRVERATLLAAAWGDALGVDIMIGVAAEIPPHDDRPPSAVGDQLRAKLSIH